MSKSIIFQAILENAIAIVIKCNPTSSIRYLQVHATGSCCSLSLYIFLKPNGSVGYFFLYRLVHVDLLVEASEVGHCVYIAPN